MSKLEVLFPNQGRSLLLPPGITLAEACDAANLPLDLVCNGRGTCGKCRIRIQEADGSQREVLACRTRLDRPLQILLQEEDYIHRAQVMTAGHSQRLYGFFPALTKRYLSPEQLTPEYCGQVLDMDAPLLLASLSRLMLQSDAAGQSPPTEQGLTLVYYDEELLAMQQGDTTARLYGAACDIGTTSVALYIYDLASGGLLYTGSALNGQITRGADVISRISYCQSQPDGTCELQRLILNTLDRLLAEASEKLPGLMQDLYSLVVCGNTTMQHLFFGFYPGALGHSPFVSLSHHTQTCRAADLGLQLPANCRVTFLPLLGGFVGADTTAVLLTLPEDDKLRLAIDLGTNGEIVLGKPGRRLAASTACGPALEGGSLTCGMRGTNGAVDTVQIRDGQLDFHCIGDEPAKGICGSGIVDLAAVLLSHGLMDASGRLLSQEEYLSQRPTSALAVHLGVHEGGNAFFLTDTVFLTQKDIRQIQLAKSAICAGCLALMANYGCTSDDIDQLVLAGAFGNHIRIESALAIGMLPPVSAERILSIGNGAGQGVCQYLLDRDARKRVQTLTVETSHQELACDPVFMEEYIMQMNFPQIATLP